MFGIVGKRFRVPNYRLRLIRVEEVNKARNGEQVFTGCEYPKVLHSHFLYDVVWQAISYLQILQT